MVTAPRSPRTPTDADTTRAILYLLSEGQSPRSILQANPGLTMLDVQGACAEGLAALEAPRVESRDERIARVRTKHPHAFEPWSGQDDAYLKEEFAAGATIAALARAFGRPPGAIRARLEKLGVEWRRASRDATPHTSHAERAENAEDDAHGR